MVLIPRDIVTQNVMCKHDVDSGTAEAGAVVYLAGDGLVAKVSASGNTPFALLGQKVVDAMPGLPENFNFSGQLGSSDAMVGDPVLLFRDGGVFESNHYDLASGCSAGDSLYAKLGDGKLTKATSGVCTDSGSPVKVATAQSSLTASEAAASKMLTIVLQIN